jgi:hypothetical protein
MISEMVYEQNMGDTEISEFSTESDVCETVDMTENDPIVKVRIVRELPLDWRKITTMSAEGIEELQEQCFSMPEAGYLIVVLSADRNGF